MARPSKYSQELRRRAIGEVIERDRPIVKVARELGFGSRGTLLNWVKQAAVTRGWKSARRLRNSRRPGLLQGWLTFFVPGVPGPEGCCYAEEVSAGVQA